MKFNVLFTVGAIVLVQLQAQASYSTSSSTEDLTLEQLSSDETITLVRIRPEIEAEQSDLYETAPEDLLISEDSLEMTEEELQAEFQVATAGEDFFLNLFGAKKKDQNEQTKGRNRQKSGAKSREVGCHTNSGGASFYWHGQKTASGDRFNPNGMTAAHRHLPFGHQLRVTNMANGKSVVVTVNDRGPFVGGRIIDLSRASFAQIASLKQGVARVRIQSVSCS